LCLIFFFFIEGCHYDLHLPARTRGTSPTMRGHGCPMHPRIAAYKAKKKRDSRSEFRGMHVYIDEAQNMMERNHKQTTTEHPEQCQNGVADDAVKKWQPVRNHVHKKKARARAHQTAHHFLS